MTPKQFQELYALVSVTGAINEQYDSRCLDITSYALWTDDCKLSHSLKTEQAFLHANRDEDSGAYQLLLSIGPFWCAWRCKESGTSSMHVFWKERADAAMPVMIEPTLRVLIPAE